MSYRCLAKILLFCVLHISSRIILAPRVDYIVCFQATSQSQTAICILGHAHHY